MTELQPQQSRPVIAAHLATMEALALRLNEPLWGIEDVSTYTATPVSTIYALRSQKRGPAGFRLGRSLRFRPADVRAWVETLAQADGSAA